MKSATSSNPPSTGLSGTPLSTFKSTGINDPEWLQKYNNIQAKYGATYYNWHTAVAPIIDPIRARAHGPWVETLGYRSTFKLPLSF
jgi:hypothetical protein